MKQVNVRGGLLRCGDVTVRFHPRLGRGISAYDFTVGGVAVYWGWVRWPHWRNYEGGDPKEYVEKLKPVLRKLAERGGSARLALRKKAVQNARANIVRFGESERPHLVKLMAVKW